MLVCFVLVTFFPFLSRHVAWTRPHPCTHRCARALALFLWLLLRLAPLFPLSLYIIFPLIHYYRVCRSSLRVTCDTLPTHWTSVASLSLFLSCVLRCACVIHLLMLCVGRHQGENDAFVPPLADGCSISSHVRPLYRVHLLPSRVARSSPVRRRG